MPNIYADTLGMSNYGLTISLQNLTLVIYLYIADTKQLNEKKKYRRQDIFYLFILIELCGGAFGAKYLFLSPLVPSKQKNLIYTFFEYVF